MADENEETLERSPIKQEKGGGPGGAPAAPPALDGGALALPKDYTYLDVELTDKRTPHDRCVRIREVHDTETAKIWLDQLMKMNFVLWKISKTLPEGKTNIFKQYLHCQHAADKRVTGKRSSKKIDCPATLTIKVQKLHKKSRSKVAGRFVPGWPTIVHFSSAHNHVLRAKQKAPKSLRQELSAETRRRLSCLFRQGHSPSSALHCLKTDFLIELDDLYDVAADVQLAPCLSAVAKLYEHEYKREYSATLSGQELLASLESLLAQYNQDCCGEGASAVLGHVGDRYFVVVCTPIMARAHALLAQAGEVVMVDAACGYSFQANRIYFLLTPTEAGGVPLGVVVTDSDGEEVFDGAMQVLKQCLPADGAFFGKGAPTAFVTDNDMRTRGPLQRSFLGSRVLVGRFHMLRGVWAWLCDAKHGIGREHCEALYAGFREVLYARTRRELDAKYRDFVASPLYQSYAYFACYFQMLWSCRMDWALAFRETLPPTGTTEVANDHLDVALATLRDCVFDRILAFSPAQLVDFVVTRYEAYVQKRLVDYAGGRYHRSLLRNMQPDVAELPQSFVAPADEPAGVYDVTSLDSDRLYTVDLAKGFCSCRGGVGEPAWNGVGTAVALCAHMFAVMLKLDARCCSDYDAASAETRATLFRVATGAEMKSRCVVVEPQATTLPGRTNSGVKMSQSTTEAGVEAMEQSVEKGLCDPMDPNAAMEEEIADHTEDQTVVEMGAAGAEEILQSYELQAVDAAEQQYVLSGGGDSTTVEAVMFDQLCARMTEALQRSPDAFVPAMRAMMQNVHDFTYTDAALVAAMHEFARPPNGGGGGGGVVKREGSVTLQDSVGVGQQKRPPAYSSMSDILLAYFPIAISDVLADTSLC